MLGSSQKNLSAAAAGEFILTLFYGDGLDAAAGGAAVDPFLFPLS